MIFNMEDSAAAASVIRCWWRDLETFGARRTNGGSSEEEEEGGGTGADGDLMVEDPISTLPPSLEGIWSEEEDDTVEVVTLEGKLVISGDYLTKKKKSGPLLPLRGHCCLSGAATEARGLRCLVGVYRRGRLNGRGKAVVVDGEEGDIALEGEFVDGRLEGVAEGRRVETGELVQVGTFKGGRSVGPHWRRTEGGGFLYGTLDGRGSFTGERNAFLYPDLRTALMGRFEGGKMVAALEAEVVSAERDRQTGTLLELRFSPPSSPEREEFSFAPSTLTEIRCPMFRLDPLERKTVLVGTSRLEGAGEGLFAARSIREGETVAFYNGIRVRPGQEAKLKRSLHYEIYVDWSRDKKTQVRF